MTRLARRPALCVLVAALALAASGCSLGSSGSGSGAVRTVHVRLAADDGGQALALQRRFVDVVQRVSPQVVQITTSEGLGSGIVFDAQGDVVTNHHVVGSAQQVRVTLADGRQYAASVVGSFAEDDLAVVRMSNHPDVKPAKFADSSKLQVGELVLAIGNPLGLQSSVTNGIVSALSRTVSEPNGAALPNTIQTSAPINPGNSGGALVDLDGSVVGIPTLAATDQQLGGGAAPGIGFAIPSNTVVDIARQLIAHGHVVNSHRAYMGVSLTTVPGGGVGVVSVQNGGPAAKAGIQPGSRITAIAGRPVVTVEELATVLAGKKPGDRISVALVTPSGQKRTVQLTLGTFPGS